MVKGKFGKTSKWFQVLIESQYDIKLGSVNKSVPNLANKSKYVVHYRHLQLYLTLGVKLIGIHKILKFEQSNWFIKYIDFDTDKRKKAVNSFEKDFFFKMINKYLWQINEKFKKKSKVRLVNNAKGCKRSVSRPTSVSQKIFSTNFVAIHEIKPVLTLDKPV